MPLKKRRQTEEERRLLLRNKLQVGILKHYPLIQCIHIHADQHQRGRQSDMDHAHGQVSAQQPLPDEDTTAHAHPPLDGEPAGPPSSASQQPKESLLAAAAKARKTQPAETEQERQLREEQQIMADLQRKQALRSAMENAQVRAPTPGLDLSMHGPVAIHVQSCTYSAPPCAPPNEPHASTQGLSSPQILFSARTEAALNLCSTGGADWSGFMAQ